MDANQSTDFLLARLLDVVRVALMPLFRRGEPERASRVFLIAEPDQILIPATQHSGPETNLPSIRDIAVHLTSLNSGISPPSLTSYKATIRAPNDLPSPTPADLAAFIFDNSHNHFLIQLIWMTLLFCGVNCERNNRFLDALSFLFYRYPHPDRAKAVRLPLPNARSFSDLLTIAGFNCPGNTQNSVEHIKSSVKGLLRSVFHRLRLEFRQDSDNWTTDILPYPAASAYGQSLVPAPLPTCVWSLRSNDQRSIAQCLSAHDHQLTSDDAISILVSHRRHKPAEIRRADIAPASIVLSRPELLAVLDFLDGTYGSHFRDDHSPTITLNAAGLTYSLPVTSHLAERGLPHAVLEPFVHHVNGTRPNGSIRHCTPHLCMAADKLRPHPPPLAVTSHANVSHLECRLPMHNRPVKF